MGIQSIRQVAESARSECGVLGLRRHTVHTVTREWSGTHVGDGTPSDTEDELLEAGYPPKVRALSGEEIAVNGLSSHTYEVGPFTPYWEIGGRSGGIQYSQLVPCVAGQATERLYRIRGAEFGTDGKLFCLADNPGVRSFTYKIRLKPIEGLDL